MLTMQWRDTSILWLLPLELKHYLQRFVDRTPQICWHEKLQRMHVHVKNHHALIGVVNAMRSMLQPNFFQLLPVDICGLLTAKYLDGEPACCWHYESQQFVYLAKNQLHCCDCCPYPASGVFISNSHVLNQ